VRNMYSRVIYKKTVLMHNFRGRFRVGVDCTGSYKTYSRGTLFKVIFGIVFEMNIVQGG
jgi:hypothetical protein